MLDIKAYFTLLKIMRKLAKNGTTLLYTTNNIESIIQETNRVILLSKGSVIADGQPYEVLNSNNISNLYNYEVEVKLINDYWKIFPK